MTVAQIVQYIQNVVIKCHQYQYNVISKVYTNTTNITCSIIGVLIQSCKWI